MEFQSVIIILISSYLIGSIPTAYVIGRLHGKNIFELGSGNMGANNTARVFGYHWGAAVWVLDGFKGITAMLIARQLVGADDRSAAMIISAVAAVTGHNWSLFASLLTGHIRGGKGAATASGTWVLLVSPILIAAALIGWAVIVALTRYVSLAVLTIVLAVSLFIIATLFFDKGDPIYIVYALVPAMVFYRHRVNIRALLSGTERRLGERAQ